MNDLTNGRLINPHLKLYCVLCGSMMFSKHTLCNIMVNALDTKQVSTGDTFVFTCRGCGTVVNMPEAIERAKNESRRQIDAGADKAD